MGDDSAHIDEFKNTSPSVAVFELPNSLLQPEIARRRCNFLPQQGKVKVVTGGRHDIEHRLSGMAHDLGRDVDSSPAQRGRVARRFYRRRTTIVFEGLVQKKRYQHRIGNGAVGRKSLQRHLFNTEGFQRPVHQYVASPSTIAYDDHRQLQPAALAGYCQCFTNGLAHAKIAGQCRIGIGKRQNHLPVFKQRSAINTAEKELPVVAFAAEIKILSELLTLLVAAPVTLPAHAHAFFDRLVKLASAGISDPRLVERFKQPLVEKSAVNANDDGSIGPIVFADLCNKVDNHLHDGVVFVAVGVSSAKNSIDHKILPTHLKRLKALGLPIGGLNSMAYQCLIVFRNHGVQTQGSHQRSLQIKPLQKQPLVQMLKLINVRLPKASGKDLYRMERKHHCRFGFRGPEIARSLDQGIETHQSTAAAVHEKGKKLFEYIADRFPLAVWPHEAEKDLQSRENIDAAKIAEKQAQTTPAGNIVGSDFNPINDGFAFAGSLIDWLILTSHALG